MGHLEWLALNDWQPLGVALTKELPSCSRLLVEITPLIYPSLLAKPAND